MLREKGALHYDKHSLFSQINLEVDFRILDIDISISDYDQYRPTLLHSNNLLSLAPIFQGDVGLEGRRHQGREVRRRRGATIGNDDWFKVRLGDGSGTTAKQNDYGNFIGNFSEVLEN